MTTTMFHYHPGYFYPQAEYFTLTICAKRGSVLSSKLMRDGRRNKNDHCLVKRKRAKSTGEREKERKREREREREKERERERVSELESELERERERERE